MNRAKLIHNLTNYQTSFVEEKAFIPRFISLLTNFHNCYQRTLYTGHITASAWIIAIKEKSVLLVHHKKLNRWLQPGGHADGEEDIINVAVKEAVEETGLKSLKLHMEEIFDIDIHLIPHYKAVQSHFHYDIRFLFSADIREQYVLSRESNKLAWIPMENIDQFVGSNKSIHRMVFKTNLIFK